MNPTSGGDYTYESAGFDGFMSRSIDDVAQVTLDSPGPDTTAVRYDSAQISGALGNSLTIGSIVIDGVKGRISIFDGANEVVRLGDLG